VKGRCAQGRNIRPSRGKRGESVWAQEMKIGVEQKGSKSKREGNFHQRYKNKTEGRGLPTCRKGGGRNANGPRGEGEKMGGGGGEEGHPNEKRKKKKEGGKGV